MEIIIVLAIVIFASIGMLWLEARLRINYPNNGVYIFYAAFFFAYIPAVLALIKWGYTP